MIKINQSNKVIVSIVLALGFFMPVAQGMLGLPVAGQFKSFKLPSLFVPFISKNINATYIFQQKPNNALMVLPKDQQANKMKAAYISHKNHQNYMQNILFQTKKDSKDPVFLPQAEKNNGYRLLGYVKKSGYSLFVVIAAFLGWQMYEQQDEKKEPEIVMTEEVKVEQSNQRDDALFLAVIAGNIEKAEQLLKAGANPDEKFCSGVLCRPLLCHAIISGKAAMVELLLKYEADVNAADDNGMPVIDYAIEYNQKEIFEILIKHSNLDINAKKATGITPLLLIAQAKKLSNKENINELINLILDNRNDVDINAQDSDGFRVYYYVAKYISEKSVVTEEDMKLLQKFKDLSAEMTGFRCRADATSPLYDSSMLLECLRLYVKRSWDNTLNKDSMLSVLKFFIKQASQEELDRCLKYEDIINWMPKVEQENHAKKILAAKQIIYWGGYGEQDSLRNIIGNNIGSYLLGSEIQHYVACHYAVLEQQKNLLLSKDVPGSK